MSSFYRNEIGKMRPEDPDSPEQSKKRQAWFTAFETRLITKLPKHLQQEIKFQVVCSVARGRAGADSDIDIVIRYRGSDELVLPQVRQAIVYLLEEMKQAGEPTFKIDIHNVDHPLMFSELALLGKSKREPTK